MDLHHFCSVVESPKYQYTVMYVNVREFNKKYVKQNDHYSHVLQHMINMFEEALVLSQNKYSKKEVIVFLNLKGAKFKNMYMMFVRDAIRHFETKYPDSLKYCIILNPSFILKMLDKIIYPLIDKDTRSKFVWEKNGGLTPLDMEDF